MSAQRYVDPLAHDRMAHGLCPECAEPADAHNSDGRFWIPRRCSLLPVGVAERIEQYQLDQGESA